MDIEEVDAKRPRFLWIVVVAVVAAALAVFILIQSGRMKPQATDVSPERQVPAARASGPGQPAWPAADTALAQEKLPVPAPVGEAPPTATSADMEKRPPPKPGPAPQLPARKPAVSQPETGKGGVVVLPTSDAGSFVVQVGSYRDERVAQAQIIKMKTYGYDAWVETADIPGKGRYYRVRVGGFQTMADAERVAKSLSAALGAECWVDNR
jgi:DedD protein